MVLVEGVQMKAKQIQKNKLAKAWKTLSSKPLPKIKALKLSDDNFNHVLEHKRCFEDKMHEMEEWGRVISTKGTDACVFNGDPEDNAEFVILIRENPYHKLDEIIVHELSHIARGDL
jgi:hypothetical protein